MSVLLGRRGGRSRSRGYQRRDGIGEASQASEQIEMVAVLWRSAQDGNEERRGLCYVILDIERDLRQKGQVEVAAEGAVRSRGVSG